MITIKKKGYTLRDLRDLRDIMYHGVSLVTPDAGLSCGKDCEKCSRNRLCQDLASCGFYIATLVAQMEQNE